MINHLTGVTEMSAFFISENTLANAVQCMAESGITRDSLARDLWRMNATALVQRYGDEPEEFEADINEYSAPKPSQDIFQILKSAQCLLYQCSEGNVPEMPLFVELQSAVDALEIRLGGADRVNCDKRYNDAKWAE
jgi:hypothetical protein